MHVLTHQAVLLSTDFTASLGCLLDPALAGLAAQLRAVRGLGGDEQVAVREGAAVALVDSVHRKVSRVLLLELNAARVTGQLGADDPRQRWDEFLALSATPGFWASLDEHYPTLRRRLDTVIRNRCAAALALARRFATDRSAPNRWLAGRAALPAGDLVEVAFGAGDSHRGGQSVAILTCTGGTTVYKPRSVSIDAVLDGFLEAVVTGPDRIRVPAVLSRDGYGWAEHVTHRYCADSAELRAFYRGIGHWLAVMRLLGGSDLHAENLIACGPVPVVVDCETLFTPLPIAPPSGLGDAVDRAADLVGGTVLRTGLLPGRGLGLGWRGVDSSAVGSLPGQQPEWEQPVILDAGSDHARIGAERVPVDAVAANHPSPEPALREYWDQVLDGFTTLTDRLASLDRRGDLAPLLTMFADCPIRVVPRATETYAELARMLWHPVSLHDQAAAVERARALLTTMAERLPEAPGDPAVIAAEIRDLLDGDVPFFTTTPRRGRLTGPRGTSWLPESDLIGGALDRWRGADLALEGQVIQAALVGAYLNEGWLPDEEPLREAELNLQDLDGRRRKLAAGIVRQVAEAALRGADGTVAWIAPVLSETGWAVQPLSPDLYGGTPGVAILLAAYRREVLAGRADPVEGVDELLAGALRTMRRAEDARDQARRAGTDLRPPPPGGYIGLGSQIWAWLVLDRWAAAGADALDRARALAELLPAAVKADDDHDVLLGSAGAVVPLLKLADRTGEDRWTDQAVAIGEKLHALGQDGRWRTARWPDGLGGFAHGSTGIGWALAHLARATGDDRFAARAAEAFAFEESLYVPARAGWTDLREPDVTAAAWCHGAVGIGLAAADLGATELARRATRAAYAQGFGWNHTLCHGDLGVWELVAAAGHDDVPDRAALDARILGGLEANGPVSGMARDAFAPGLLPGLGGVAYQLLRMHPDAELPSVLTPGSGA